MVQAVKDKYPWHPQVQKFTHIDSDFVKFTKATDRLSELQTAMSKVASDYPYSDGRKIYHEINIYNSHDPSKSVESYWNVEKDGFTNLTPEELQDLESFGWTVSYWEID